MNKLVIIRISLKSRRVANTSNERYSFFMVTGAINNKRNDATNMSIKLNKRLNTLQQAHILDKHTSNFPCTEHHSYFPPQIVLRPIDPGHVHVPVAHMNDIKYRAA